MAKRRNTAALFEVFHDTRGPATSLSVGSALSGFRSWFKGRTASLTAEEIDPNDPTTTPIKSPLILSREIRPEPAAARSEAAAAPAAIKPQPAANPVAVKPQPSAAAAPALAAKVEAVLQKVAAAVKAPAQEKPAPASTAPASDPPAAQPASNPLRHFQFHLDRDRREVTMRVRLTTAVVLCFGIVLTVALSYVLGRKAGARPTVLAAETQTDPHRADVKPNVLEIPRRPVKPTGTGTSTKPPARPGNEANGHDHNAAQPNTPAGITALPPVPPEDDRRTIGLNYFIIYGGPEAGAADARDFFIKNGVPCSVEKMPAGFSSSSMAVITRQGFEHLSGAECDKLKKQIEKTEAQLATNSRSKRFYAVPFKLKD